MIVKFCGRLTINIKGVLTFRQGGEGNAGDGAREGREFSC